MGQDAKRGVGAGPPISAQGRFFYPDGPTFRYPLSPVRGGWSLDAGEVLNWQEAATPPHVNGSTATTYSHASKGLPLLYNVSDAPSGVLYRIENISIDYFRNAAGQTLRLRLYRHDRDKASAAVQVLSWDETAEFTTTAAWTTYLGSVAHNVVVDQDYWIELRLGTGAGAATDIRVGTVYADVRKYAVE